MLSCLAPPSNHPKHKTLRTSLEPSVLASVWESITALMARSVKRSNTALTTSEEGGEERRRGADDVVAGAPLPARRSAAGREDPRARRAAPTEEAWPAAATTRAERDAEARGGAKPRPAGACGDGADEGKAAFTTDEEEEEDEGAVSLLPPPPSIAPDRMMEWFSCVSCLWAVEEKESERDVDRNEKERGAGEEKKEAGSFFGFL